MTSALILPVHFEVDISWSAGQLTQAALRSLRGETCRLRLPAGVVARVTRRDIMVGTSAAGGEEVSFSTTAGESYIVKRLAKAFGM